MFFFAQLNDAELNMYKAWEDPACESNCVYG